MQVLISCPKCNTSYQIDEAQLKQADGQARCYHCQSVFNAALNAQPLPDNSQSDKLNLPDSKALNSQQLDDHADHEHSSLFVPENQSQILTGPEDVALQDSSILAPEDFLDIDSETLIAIEPLSLEKPVKKARTYSTTASLLWSLGILLLIIIFLAQVGWYYRQQLLLNTQARNLIEQACQYITCDLPPRRDPQAFEVVERHVSIHPEVRGILSISILFANHAKFAQPAPGITLSLFDTRQQIVARRSFSHKDYLDHYSRKAPIFDPGQTQKIFLNLEDPGPDVTGFEFSFF